MCELAKCICCVTALFFALKLERTVYSAAENSRLNTVVVLEWQSWSNLMYWHRVVQQVVQLTHILLSGAISTCRVDFLPHCRNSSCDWIPLLNHNTMNRGGFHATVKLLKWEYCIIENVTEMSKGADNYWHFYVFETGHYEKHFHHQPNMQNVWGANERRNHKELSGDPKDFCFLSGFLKASFEDRGTRPAASAWPGLQESSTSVHRKLLCATSC